MIVRNGTSLTGGPLRYLGMNATHVANRLNWAQRGALNNFWMGEATVIDAASIANKSAFPSGYTHPWSWNIAMKPGGMAARVNRIVGSGEIAGANLAGGLYFDTLPLTGAGEISSAEVAWLGQLSSTIGGDGAISSANLSGALGAEAAIAGVGTISSADGSGGAPLDASLSGAGEVASANLLGSLSASATLSGSGEISGADLLGGIYGTATLSGAGAVAADLLGAGYMTTTLSGASSVAADLLASGNLSITLAGVGAVSSDMAGYGFVSADIAVTGEVLSTANVGAAVWNEVLESVAGGTPFTAGEIQQTIFAVLAGLVSGGPGSPVFKSPSDGTTPRVSVTADSSGNRTVVTITLT